MLYPTRFLFSKPLELKFFRICTNNRSKSRYGTCIYTRKVRKKMNLHYGRGKLEKLRKGEICRQLKRCNRKRVGRERERIVGKP